MNTIRNLIALWQQDRRYATRYLLVAAGNIFIHTVLVLLFLIMGRPGLAAFNGFSLFAIMVWIYFFSRIRINAPLLLSLYLDVVIHCCVYNILLGAETAFYVYPFILIPVNFFLSIRDTKTKHATLISAILALISVLLMLATLTGAPSAPLENTEYVADLFHINLLICAMFLSVYTSEYISETINTQSTLSFHADNDQLTGLHNRYGFSKEISRIHGTHYTVVMCDIDNFKQVNDLYGHNVGDELLIKISRMLSAGIRKDDLLCRWGGEEFLLVLRSDLPAAHAAVSAIRQALTAVSVETGTASVNVSMTFGIASCLESESFETLVKIADANLLRGKRAGKNCIVLSDTHLTEFRGAIQQSSAPLDTSFLDEWMFSAFSATSDTTYIYVCNMSTNVSRWSRTAVDYFGLPAEYMLDAGNIWLGFVHPDDRQMYSEDLEAVFSGKKRFHDVTYRARNRDGDYVRLSCRGVVTEGDSIHPTMFAGTMTNLGVSPVANSKLR